jgi:hypothetical protein
MNHFCPPLWEILERSSRSRSSSVRYKVWQLEFKRFAASDAHRFQKAISSFLPWSVHQSRGTRKKDQLNLNIMQIAIRREVLGAWEHQCCRRASAYCFMHILYIYTILYYYRIVTPLQPEDLVCASGNIQSAPYDTVNGRQREWSDGSL